ncbi:MAG: histidine--tRNA ligase [Dehalococcoidia bacterium]|nr:histidine--tRNA ligase [Dehalococcoidia bacterium]RLC64319.1 MAG: histidine--tRNA ligase [Chloroflexota bacterium]
MYKAPRGTSDILPEEYAYWKYVEEKAAVLCHLYGYRPLNTPIFEDAQLFTKTVASGTDIVDKEMYIFEDKSGQELALRAEGTAPVCRAYLEHGLFNLAQPVKLYYSGPAFRYERPQSGRYRQHHQVGFEALGEADPALDAEVIEMGWQFFRSLGLSGISIQLNSIGCKLCRPGYLEVLKQHYSSYKDRLCPDCKARLTRNPLRLLDCKKASCQDIAKSAPKIPDYLCHECQLHFQSVQNYLRTLRTPFQLNHRLVRGLDYYTRTVFEVEPPEKEGQSTLGGGGRYDDLIEALGGKPTPAVGFAAGLERIILNLKGQHLDIPPLPQPDAFVAYLGQEFKIEAMKIASELRKAEIATIMATGDKSLKGQMRQANSLGSTYVLILGEQESRNKNATLRDMKSGEQQTIPVAEIANIIKSRLHDSQK